MATTLLSRNASFTSQVLPTLNGAGFQLGETSRESTAKGHYILGESLEKSVVDLSGNAHHLSVPFDQPVVGDGYCEVDSMMMFDTGLVIGDELTMAVVFKRVGNGLVIGNLGRSGGLQRLDRNEEDLIGSASIFTSTDITNFNAGYSQPMGASSGSISNKAQYIDDSWCFAAYCISPTSTHALTSHSGINNLLKAAHPGTAKTTTAEGKPVQNLHIGNPNYSSMAGKSLVAEAVFFERSLGHQELIALYKRSQARMKLKGIII
ncbi:hypothetical protein [Vibrio navarrensis]|uniref:Uncharacterized protein n=1 Tax=Vibrio navarrensis TaxID=29495 RepID=A0AAJ4LVF0_9VIBR|nr:hypothetical protein I3X05_06775 [Vibrio navarrensis]